MLENKKKLIRMQIAGVIVLLICFSAYSISLCFQVDKKGRYTIGVLKGVSAASDGGLFAEFEYTVNGINYKESCGVPVSFENSIRQNIGDTFFIKYAIISPYFFECSFDKKAHQNDYKRILPDGWNKLP